MGFRLIRGEPLFSRKIDRPAPSKYRIMSGGLSEDLTTVTPETTTPRLTTSKSTSHTYDNRKYNETISEYKPTKPTFKKKVGDVFEIAKKLLTNQPTEPEEIKAQADTIRVLAQEANVPFEQAAIQYQEGLVKSIPRLIKLGHLTKQNNDIGRSVMLGTMHPDAAIDKSNKILQDQEPLIRDPDLQKYRNKNRIIRQAFEGAAGTSEFMVRAQISGVPTGLAGAGVGALRGGKPGAAAGYLLGSKVGVVAYTAGQEGGGMMMDLLHNEVDPKIARPISLIGGVLSGLIESSQQAKIFKGLPMGEKLTGVLGNPGLKKTFMKVLQTLGKDYPVEVMEEVQQYLTTEGGKSLAELLNSLSTGGKYKGRTIGAIAGGAIEEGKAAAISLLPIVGAGGVVQTIQQNRLNQQQDKKVFRRMQDATRVEAMRRPVQPKQYKVISGEEMGLPRPDSNLGPVTGDIESPISSMDYKVVSGKEVQQDDEMLKGVEMEQDKLQLEKEFDEVYTPNTKLKGVDAESQDKGYAYAKANIGNLMAEYEKKESEDPESSPNLIATDKFRWLLKPAGFKGPNSAAFHEPASALKKIYEKRIVEKAIKDKKFTALLMSGGSGSGKSGTLVRMSNFKSEYGYILDSNLGDLTKAISQIELLKERGLKPQVLYVHRHPVLAWNGVLHRIISGSDPRVVPLDEHIKLHIGSLDTAKGLISRYGRELEIKLLDNSGKHKQEREITLDELEKISYNQDVLREVLENETITQYQQGTIDLEVVEAALGRKLTRAEVRGRGQPISESTEKTQPISTDQRSDDERLRQPLKKPFRQRDLDETTEDDELFKDVFSDPEKHSIDETQLHLFPTERKAAHGTMAKRDANYKKAIEDIRKTKEKVPPKPLTTSQKKSVIADELSVRGFIDYRGQKIGTSQDLAELAVAFRHPRIEQLQVFFVKKGVIVGHRILTSGQIGSVSINQKQTERIRYAKDRLGADSIYFAHNHPGGDPNPSKADLAFTARQNLRLDGAVKGHLVLDGSKFCLILKGPKGTWKKYSRKYVNPKVDYEKGVPLVLSDSMMVDQVKRVFSGDKIYVIYIDNQLHAEGIEAYNPGTNLSETIANGKKYNNSSRYAIVVDQNIVIPEKKFPSGMLSFIKMGKDGAWKDVSVELNRSGNLTLEKEQKTPYARGVQERQATFKKKLTTEQLRTQSAVKAKESLESRATMQDIVDDGPLVAGRDQHLLDKVRSLHLDSDEAAVIIQFEKVKDIWLGDKDSRVHETRVELRRLQTAIKQAVGSKRFDDKAKMYDRAIQMYIDTKRNPGHIEKFRDKLTSEQLKILELSQKLPANIRAIADQIQKSYKEIGQESYDLEIIKNVHDNYAARIWDFETAVSTKHRKFGTTTKHALQRKLETIIEGWAKGYTLKVGGATGNLQILKEELIKTIEDKKFIKTLKQLKTVDGKPILSTRHFPGAVRVEHPNFKQWSWIGLTPKPEVEEIKQVKGEDRPSDKIRTVKQYVQSIGVDPNKMAGFTLADFKEFGLSGAIKKGGMGLDVIAADLIDSGELTAFEGESPTDTLVEAMQTGALLNSRADEYKPDQAKLFSRRVFRAMSGDMFERKELYAPKYVADSLNTILGVSKLKGVWKIGGTSVIDKVTKYNAIMKSWRLLTSFFHHMAYMRSYYFGTNKKKWGDMSIRQAYKQGLKAVDDASPVIELGIKNGLTLGIKQDWSEDLVRETNAIREMMKKNKYSEKIQNVILDLRERQVNFLFGEFGAGLKAKSFLIEFGNMMNKHPEMDPDRAARLVANLINDDFGGLNLARIGRDPTLQHIFRLFCLAPDWTESNIRSMVKAIRTSDKVEQEMYRHFWAGVMGKTFAITIVANMLLNRSRAGEEWKKAWLEGKFRWLDIDITNLYRALGGKGPARKYFNIMGHFRDPIKFVLRNERNRAGKISFQPGNLRAFKHKGSVVSGLFLDFMSGTDWSGRRFTTVKELFGIDTEKGYYKTTRKGHYNKGDPKYGKLKGRSIASAYTGRTGILEAEQMPSYVLAQLKSGQPVPIQKMMAWWTGEMEAFDAIGQAAGLRISTTYPRKEDKEIDKKKFPNISQGYKTFKPTIRAPFARRSGTKRTFKRRSYR